jgi:hypothetical protein
MTFVYTGVEQLNEYLSTRSFIDGWSLSKADPSTLKYISNDIDHDAYPHVARWSALVRSFPPCVRARWPGREIASEGNVDFAEEGKYIPTAAAEEVAEEVEAENIKDNEVEVAEEAEYIPVAEGDEVPDATDAENIRTDNVEVAKEAPVVEGEAAIEGEDEEIEFEMDFGDDLNDDEDDDETKAKMAKVSEQVKAIQARQSENAPNAKSNVTFDVKPADDETGI